MVIFGFASAVAELLTTTVIVHVGRIVPLLADVTFSFRHVAASVISLSSEVEQAMIFSVGTDDEIARLIVVPSSVDVMDLCAGRQ
jgi:hypothetical protein